MDVTAPDGRRWLVSRRRLAWRPRLPPWIHTWWPSAIDDDSVIGLVTAREIHRHGAPLSLAAPPAKLLALTVESGRPIVERLKERLRSR